MKEADSAGKTDDTSQTSRASVEAHGFCTMRTSAYAVRLVHFVGTGLGPDRLGAQLDRGGRFLRRAFADSIWRFEIPPARGSKTGFSAGRQRWCASRDKGQDMTSRTVAAGTCALLLIISLPLSAASAADCPANHDQLVKALRSAVHPTGGPSNGGLDNNEWAAVVDRTGGVCAVAFSGDKVDDQWLGSRAIAAEKANTANSLSLKRFAISTANLYAGAQPSGFLFGLQFSNPVNPAVLYAGDPSSYGTSSDPFTGKQLGGVIVFGGGLALYSESSVVGGLGVSGDSSCADHNVAWRIRHSLGLDRVPDGPSPKHNDAIVYDIKPDKTSESGYGHAKCNGSEMEIAEQLGAGVVPPWNKAMKQ